MDDFIDVRMSPSCTPPRLGMPVGRKVSVLMTILEINVTKRLISHVKILNRRYELTYD